MGAGDGKLHALVCADRPSKHYPLVGIGHRLLDEPARVADALRSDEDAFCVQPVEQVAKARPFLADERIRWQPEVLDKECVGLVIDHGLDRPDLDR